MKDYAERVQEAMDLVHCPTCGAKAAVMAFGWSDSFGAFIVAPVFSCDTPGCEFSTPAEASWTAVSTN